MQKEIKEIEREMRSLEETIEYNSRLYYELDSPIMQDEEYDRIFRRLQELEKEYPSLVNPNSPTKRVGGKVSEKFEKVRHSVIMDSFDDIFSEEEIYDFVDKKKRISRCCFCR